MRLITYTLLYAPQPVRLGAQLDGKMLDLVAGERAMNDGKQIIPASMKGLLALGEAGLARARTVLEYAGKNATKLGKTTLAPDADVHYLPPIPDADKFLCVGKNYRTHLEELKRNDLTCRDTQKLKSPRARVSGLKKRTVLRPAGPLHHH